MLSELLKLNAPPAARRDYQIAPDGAAEAQRLMRAIDSSTAQTAAVSSFAKPCAIAAL